MFLAFSASGLGRKVATIFATLTNYLSRRVADTLCCGTMLVRNCHVRLGVIAVIEPGPPVFPDSLTCCWVSLPAPLMCSRGVFFPRHCCRITPSRGNRPSGRQGLPGNRRARAFSPSAAEAQRWRGCCITCFAS